MAAPVNAARPPRLSGWGRLSVPGRERRSEDFEALTRDAVLSRGLGRAYGDSALPPPTCFEVAASPLADRLLSFDRTTGVLRATYGDELVILDGSGQAVTVSHHHHTH